MVLIVYVMLSLHKISYLISFSKCIYIQTFPHLHAYIHHRLDSEFNIRLHMSYDLTIYQQTHEIHIIYNMKLVFTIHIIQTNHFLCPI